MSENGPKIKAFAIGVKMELNLHDLNNELATGNVSAIRVAKMLVRDENGKQKEVPVQAVSGRMIKHWHWEHYRRRFTAEELCGACAVGETIRPVRLENGIWKFMEPEDAVRECAACDVHGFLIPTKSLRRNSLALFSWLLPPLDSLEYALTSATHSRVAATDYPVEKKRESEEESSEGKTGQMIYNKVYASGTYAFVSYLDVEHIGYGEKREGQERVSFVPLVEEPRKRLARAKAAILAYQDMLTGRLGASQAFALPHAKVLSFLACYSCFGQFPVPVSPIYPDFVQKTVELMPNEVKILGYGIESHDRITEKPVSEIFNEIIGKLEGSCQ
ncbi:MAG: DevR family CRISPR-associated autoregulator [candidate division WOR-3 bacterium]